MMNLLLRVYGVVRKEITELARQPGLLLIMVVGPLAILLLFGAGVRPVDPAVDSIFVTPADEQLATLVRDYAESQSERLNIVDVTDDREGSLEALRDGRVRMVVVFPDDPLDAVERDEKAIIEVWHSFIDPIEAQAIDLFARSAVDDLNDALLRLAVEEIQQVAGDVAPDLQGDARADLERLATMDSEVLVAPLERETQPIGGEVTVEQFYAPAVIALILQQLTLTFIALSVAREREQGVEELLGISPLRPRERAVGKAVAYLVMGAALSAAMVAACVFLLDVPLRGGVAPVAIVLGVELVASIVAGFLLALVARRTTQVVQGAMLLLLLSVFFGGLLLSPARLAEWVRPVGQVLPMGQALEPLREAMLSDPTQ